MESQGLLPVAAATHTYDLRSARHQDGAPATEARHTMASQESEPVPLRMAASPDQDPGHEQQQQPQQPGSAGGAAFNRATVEQSPTGGA